jgi:hypothetical protein
MRSDSLEVFSLCLGPFPNRMSNYNLEIALLIKLQEVKTIFSLSQWREHNQDLDENDIEKYLQWIPVEVEEKNGEKQQKWYLRFNMDLLD